MKKHKVCLATWHTSLNYGTCIQAYALAEYLRNNGFDVYIPDSFRYYYGLKHPFETLSNVMMKLRRKRNDNIVSTELKDRYDARYRKNEEFAREMSGVISFSSRQEYHSIISNTDIFVSGSDQIWNPGYVTPPMLLSIADNSRQKIAYGSSIGVSEIPDNKLRIYRKYLPRFEYIGVREEIAKIVLSKIIEESKIQVVLDPSFLLTKDEWEQIAQKPDGVEENKSFVFCYFIGNSDRWVNDVDRYSKRYPCEVVCMPSEAMIIPSQFNCIIDAGVKEFIWCLLHAKLVVTDSFHATALSINFHTNFITYKRFEDSDKQSQNSRIINILNTFDLQNRLHNNGEPIEDIEQYFEHSQLILDSLRKESSDFLRKGVML